MKKFDFYEFTGILVPGVVILYAVSMIIPELSFLARNQAVSVGDLGLFVVLSYVAGHLIQAFGNILEQIFWSLNFGNPSDWPRTRNKFLLTDDQTAKLETRTRKLLDLDPSTTISTLSKREWSAITRQIYAVVQSANKSQRIDTFNGNYGMFRGIGSAFLLCSVLSLFTLPQGWKVLVVFLGCTVIAFYRMHRFGVHYARELFVQFLQIGSIIQKEEK